MEYPINIKGFEGRETVIRDAGFFSAPKLIIDGQPASKGPKRGQLSLRRNDGTEVLAQLKTSFVDPAPKLVIEGETIETAAPLPWHQWLWAALPFALVFAGGALGGLFGGIATIVNGRIFRSNMSEFVKFMVSGVVSIATVIVFFVVALIINIYLGSG